MKLVVLSRWRVMDPVVRSCMAVTGRQQSNIESSLMRDAPTMSTTVTTAPDAPNTSSFPAGSGVALNAAFAGVRRVPQPVNDPNRTYAPGTPERAELKARLEKMAGEKIE